MPNNSGLEISDVAELEAVRTLVMVVQFSPLDREENGQLY